MANEYAIYDMKDYEQCVRIGTMKEISKFLNCSSDSVRSYMSHKKAGRRDSLIQKRYDVVKIIENEKEDNIKSNTEIFKELINTFMPEKHNFPIYDSVKDEIKHKMNMTIVNEEWQSIKDFNYSVSNYGRVKNNTTNKFKELRTGRYGFQINLWDKSKSKMFTMSRLVANYFIREVKDNERVRHIDGDIRNNYYKNLEIVSK